MNFQKHGIIVCNIMVLLISISIRRWGYVMGMYSVVALFNLIIILVLMGIGIYGFVLFVKLANRG